MSWSSGKDSAYALAELRRDPTIEVTGLLVTLDGDARRVSMHGVRRDLVLAQAERLGLPARLVELPSPCPNEVYEAAMRGAVAAARADGVTVMGFGDLFLTDVRAYRESALGGTGIVPVFPLWGRPTDQLARQMLAAGVRATLTSVDTTLLPAELAGRAWDTALIAALPPGADPCGEHGEFHTFVSDAPGFGSPVPVTVGAVTHHEGFARCDLVGSDG